MKFYNVFKKSFVLGITFFIPFYLITIQTAKANYSNTLKKGVNNVKIISGDKLEGYQDIFANKKPKNKN